MYYGDLVTVVPDKIRISEKELAPIGILDQSVCWSRWIPDRWAPPPPQGPPPHLVVSPFDIASWPVLFRLTILLEDGHGGPLAQALRVLREHSFNILAIEGTPAGHHHAVVNIIGEAVSLKNDGSTLSFGSAFPDEARLFTNERLARCIHDDYAPRLLSYSMELTKGLLDANASANGGFLRYSFVKDALPERSRGILYDPARLPAEIAAIGQAQSTPAVSCKWLQNHAFFWIYGAGRISDKTLTYDARSWALRPAAMWKKEFAETIAALKPPFKTVSSINFEEQYLRLTFSPMDRRGNTFRIKMPYEAKFPAGGTTQGALAEICTHLSRNALTLRSVAVSTEYRDSSIERGTYTFLASIVPEAMTVFSSLSEPEKVRAIHGFAKESTDAATRSLAADGCNVGFTNPAVSVFAGRTLFLSTKFDWIKDTRPRLVEKLRERAVQFGYILIMADLDYLDEDHRFYWNGSEPITSNIIRLMRSADAFLQIIPRSAIEATIGRGNLSWLLFESGAAHALRIPCAINVDTSGDQRLSIWGEELKAGTEKKIFSFSTEHDDEQIVDAMNPALEYLASEGRPVRTGRFFDSDHARL